MTSVRDLAEEFHCEWLAAHPFDASYDGIPGFDDRVPDDSEGGEMAWRSAVEAVRTEAHAMERTKLSAADAVTLDCLVEFVDQELANLDSAPLDHTVTAMPFGGPAMLLAVAAVTVLGDSQTATHYLQRLRRSGMWLDQQTERLQNGAAKGRVPVAPLVEQAIAWAEAVLAEPVPAALAAPQPPPDWDGAAAWELDRDAAAAEVVLPALRRWVDVLRDLLPQTRSADHAGLCHLPGGAADYSRAIRSQTTLPLTAEQLHQTGLDEINLLERRAVELGAELGLSDLPAIHEALRTSSSNTTPQEAIEAAVRAIRRAEAHASDAFPRPLPPPCAVSPMPHVVGGSGMAPHYSPPRLDGTRPGTYWFNVDRPTAGAGWDLEGVAFHETVPGHHLQLSRIQLLTDLPALQRQRDLSVFSEGWGLYAEQLAEEMGLYSGAESILGAVTAALLRAARLVVDTGLHAYGWSRRQALGFFTAHVPLPPEFIVSEIDRYIAVPGQALAYLTGKLEILRLRGEAERRLGSAFSLPEFHAAILDHGSLPMPVLQRSVESWIESRWTRFGLRPISRFSSHMTRTWCLVDQPAVHDRATNSVCDGAARRGRFLALLDTGKDSDQSL